MAELPRYYARSLNYFGKPTDKAAVVADKQRYFERWPTRVFTIRPDSLEVTCPQENTCIVTGLVDWNVSDVGSVR